MAYPLGSMIRIRSMREDRAATDLTRARRARTAAERTLREKTEAVERYEETKEDRRDRVYDAVMGHAVKIEALDRARDAVNRIDEEGLLLEEDEKKAQKRKEDASVRIGVNSPALKALKDLQKSHADVVEELSWKQNLYNTLSGTSVVSRRSRLRPSSRCRTSSASSIRRPSVCSPCQTVSTS